MRNCIALPLTLALAGCGWPALVPAPTVTSSIPASNAVNVARNATISATFSEAVVATSFGVTTFTISPAVAGTVSTSGSTATFTPTALFTVGTKYTATIAAAAQGATGGPLAADYTWSFTTVPSPTVVTTSPANGAAAVARDTTISATFSEAMVANTLGGSTFTISPPVAGSVNTSGSTATFTPQAPLAYDTPYTATITTAATGQAGGPLAAAYSWSFTVVPAPATPPVVSSIIPANSAPSVDIHAPVSATFSKPMLDTSVIASFSVSSATGAVTGTVAYTGLTATFTPASSLQFNTPYTATVTTAATDSGGTHISANYLWTFTTAVAVAPSVSSTSPANGEGNVARAPATVTATFSTDMKSDSVVPNFTLTSTGPGPAAVVPGTVAYSAKTATFTPTTAPLPYGTNYTAKITTGAKDMDDTPLAADKTWTFTTLAATPPVITSTTPANGATGVAIGPPNDVIARFSKSMTGTSVTQAGTFTISPLTNLSPTVTYSPGTSSPSKLAPKPGPQPPSATLTPGAALQYDTTYIVKITTAAKDFEGTPLAADKTWTFHTVAVPGGPTANAGANQEVARSQNAVQLSGSGSSPGGLTLTYQWSQTFGTAVSLSNSTVANPTFNAPADVGTLQFQLKVTDTVPQTSAASLVQVYVMEQPGNAFFVSKSGLEGAAGTRAAPMLRIQAAIDAGKSSGSGADVYVGGGIYTESLELADQVSIYGGFDDNWVRNYATVPNSITQVSGVTGTPWAIRGIGVTLLTIDGLTVKSAPATTPGESSYGFLFSGSSQLTLTHNTITAGSGATGVPGIGGDPGTDGATGNPGHDGCNPECPSPAGGSGGGGFSTIAGGAGGGGGDVASGGPGLAGKGNSGGSGVLGGTFSTNALLRPGTDGTPAPTNGAPGGPGQPGSDTGAGRTAGGYVPTCAGTTPDPGLPGSGGGGGGGGAGNCGDNCSGKATGNGGGGGGQGGGGGGPGSGGQGGGGSFGIYSYSSTFNQTTASLKAQVVQFGPASQGGQGGDGGRGGFGRPGGPGPSVATPYVGKGGDGGRGSDGGKGGKGGQGCAGPALDVYP